MPDKVPQAIGNLRLDHSWDRTCLAASIAGSSEAARDK